MTEWISVKDKLPLRRKGEILTFHMIENHKGKIVPYVSIEPTDCLYVYKGKLYSENVGAEVTHWMPMPNPPKDEK